MLRTLGCLKESNKYLEDQWYVVYIHQTNVLDIWNPKQTLRHHATRPITRKKEVATFKQSKLHNK